MPQPSPARGASWDSGGLGFPRDVLLVLTPACGHHSQADASLTSQATDQKLHLVSTSDSMKQGLSLFSPCFVSESTPQFHFPFLIQTFPFVGHHKLNSIQPSQPFLPAWALPPAWPLPSNPILPHLLTVLTSTPAWSFSTVTSTSAPWLLSPTGCLLPLCPCPHWPGRHTVTCWIKWLLPNSFLGSSPSSHITSFLSRVSLRHDFTSYTFRYLSSAVVCKHYMENSRAK